MAGVATVIGGAMLFESKRNRSLWFSAALNTVPDIAISAVITTVFDGGFIGFIVALVGLQVLYLAIWIKDSIWAWTVFALGARKRAATMLFDYFRENGYPEPAGKERSALGYLSSVIENEKIPTFVRLRAAAEVGAMNYLESSLEMQKAIRLSIALEDALEELKRSYSRSNSAMPADVRH